MVCLKNREELDCMNRSGLKCSEEGESGYEVREVGQSKVTYGLTGHVA